MIGRELEIEELGAVAALRTNTNERGERIAEEPAPLVIVYGGASTGKSTCVAQALQRHAELYAMVDCTAIYSAQEFYREILVQLYKNLRVSAPQFGGSADSGTDGGSSRADIHANDELTIEGAHGGIDAKRRRNTRSRAATGSDSDSCSSDRVDTNGGGGGENGGNSDDSCASDDRELDEHDLKRKGRSAQRAVARAKRVRAHQREQQAQRDAAASSSRVSYEGYNSLNFLSFIKALGQFMVAVTTAAAANDSNGALTESLDADMGERVQTEPQRKRVVHLALDQADKLLDRGLAPLLTCIFTVNDQLAYLNMFTGMAWDVSVLLITRAMSLEFDRLVAAFFPAYIAFPPYTSEQVADILVEQLRMQPVARLFRRWLLHLSALMPPSQGDWLEFRRHVVHLLPDFRSFFTVVTVSAGAGTGGTDAAVVAAKAADKATKMLTRATNERAIAFEKTRRKHLFGHDKLPRSGGDPTDSVACTDLSRSCLLLVIAGYLASFNPQDADAHFLSSSGGTRRKKRVRKTTAATSTTSSTSSSAAVAPISQLLIGPRIFTLQRLLAIYLNLRAEASADLSDQFAVVEAREDIFTHLATLVRMQLFQRTSPPNMLDDIKFRCLADSRFVHETARLLRFPLESYLNTTT